MHHRDPFDRLLVAQALTEGLPIVTADTRFHEYAVDTRW
jgi:PIN domain nuclease of toxin-antitoxin system